MRLKHLTIANCSRVSDIDIDIRSNLVLIGPNGSGKTTVLLCLDMLLGMNSQQLRSAFCADLIRNPSQQMTIEVAFTELSDDESATFSNEITATSGREMLVRLEARLDGANISVWRSFLNGKDPKGKTPGSLLDSQIDAFGWSVIYSQESLLDARADWQSVIDSAKSVSNCSKLVHEQWGGIQSPIALAMHEQLSRGSSVLAIDEPEAHLHPSSQRSLAKMLKAGNCQKILVTHSPTIAGSFSPDEIVVIRSDGTAVQPKEGFLEGNAGMLARWWIGKQLEPLTAGSVIAVEGPSDRIIVDKVASASGFDLDRHDVVLVETSGCGDMKVIESIFGNGGFDIPLFELIDEDAADEAAERLGIDEGGLEARNVFVSTSDLEDEYVQAIGAKRLWDAFKARRAFSASSLSNCATGPDGYPTEADLAQFIRSKSKRKIPAALIAASLIDASNAHRVRSVARLVEAAS